MLNAFLLKFSFATTYSVECKQYLLLLLFWKHKEES